MIEITNDCGPLFSKVFSYNTKAVNPVMFSWPSNDHTDDNEYFLVVNNGDIDTKEQSHKSRVKIKKNITYAELEKILNIYTPHIVFIFSRILDPHAVTTVSPSPYNDVTTLIYGGSDLRLDYISTWFPRLKYIYVYRLNKPDIQMEKIHMPHLEVLSCWYGDLEMIEMIDAPLLQSLDVYRRVGAASKLKIDNMARVRIDAHIRLEFDTNDRVNTNLEVLQFFPNNEKVPPNLLECLREDPERLFNLLKHFVPKDLLMPPKSSLKANEIELLYETRLAQFGDQNKTLGVYINDAELNTYMRLFNNLQIFDNIQPLKCASTRNSDDVVSFLPKDMDSGIVDKMFSHNKRHNILLSNFNIFTDKNNKLWLNTFGQRFNNYVYICSSELLLDNESKWPNLVKNVKNRVFIYSPETDSVYLDINRKPIFTIAALLRKIYDHTSFRNVYIAMRNDEQSNNHAFEQSLYRELGIEKKLNIYKFDLPAKILTF